jgi:hypothetical protein
MGHFTFVTSSYQKLETKTRFLETFLLKQYFASNFL